MIPWVVCLGALALYCGSFLAYRHWRNRRDRRQWRRAEAAWRNR